MQNERTVIADEGDEQRRRIVEIGEAAALDVDTPEDLIAACGVPFTGDAQGTV